MRPAIVTRFYRLYSNTLTILQPNILKLSAHRQIRNFTWNCSLGTEKVAGLTGGYQELTASFSALPALKLGTLAAAI
jgi:hypothetical protein